MIMLDMHTLSLKLCLALNWKWTQRSSRNGIATTFPSQAISEAQYQINAVINNSLKVEIGPIVRSRAIFMALSVTET